MDYVLRLPLRFQPLWFQLTGSANEGTGIVVAVGLDTVSDNAVNFGVEEAKRTKQPLKLVTAWGLPLS